MSKIISDTAHAEQDNVIPLPIPANGIYVDAQGNKIVEPVFCGIGGTVAGQMAVKR